MACRLVRDGVINTPHVIMFCLVLIHISYTGDEWDKFPTFQCNSDKGLEEDSRALPLKICTLTYEKTEMYKIVRHWPTMDFFDVEGILVQFMLEDQLL